MRGKVYLLTILDDLCGEILVGKRIYTFYYVQYWPRLRGESVILDGEFEYEILDVDKCPYTNPEDAAKLRFRKDNGLFLNKFKNIKEFESYFIDLVFEGSR